MDHFKICWWLWFSNEIKFMTSIFIGEMNSVTKEASYIYSHFQMMRKRLSFLIPHIKWIIIYYYMMFSYILNDKYHQYLLVRYICSSCVIFFRYNKILFYSPNKYMLINIQMTDLSIVINNPEAQWRINIWLHWGYHNMVHSSTLRHWRI